MQQSKFLKNKISRQIQMNGMEVTFVRYKEDKYHQLTDEVDEEFTFHALFHTTNTFVRSQVEDAAKTVSKPQPMILCLFEDGERIEVNDKVTISDQEYIVTDKNNMNGFNVAFDISLELIKCQA